MTPRRVCSECGETLVGKDSRAKTCGDECRQKRSRRLKRQKDEFVEAGPEAQRLPDHAQLAKSIVHREVKDAARDVMHDELKPIVRDAITADTLRAIGDMVALTPRVVELLARDMESDDSAIAQRAYTLVAKYTLGHPALVRPEEPDTSQQLVVNFQLPRPGDEVAEHETLIPLDADEIKQCDNCEEDKPLIEFVANSSRCVKCHDEFLARARAITEKKDAG